MIEKQRARRILVVAGLALALARAADAAQLDGPATLVYDQYRVPTIVAQTEHDAIFLQGYLHAKNRLFQMDFQRRLFSGRVSELVGSSGLPQDIQLRTLGLRRAAERSLLVQTPESLAWLQAYADGVNAFLANTAEPLPIEYGALEMNRAGIPPWTPLDSLTMAKGLAFGLSFDLGDINRTLALLNFRGACTVMGCNGLQLYNDDLWRVAPFESGVSIPPPPLFGPEDPVPAPPAEEQYPPYMADPDFQSMVEGYRDEIAEIPVLKDALEKDSGQTGSNWWIVGGAKTESGHPMLANDPHLSLGSPSTFYEVHLNVTGGINVTGVSFPGTPGIVLGCNDTVCWGATVNGMDVTDVFNEVLLPLNPSAPTTPTHILFQGVPEPLQFIPQTFLFNVIGDGVPNSLVDAGIPSSSGGVTMVVPRRNNGPIVSVTYNPASPTPLTGLSVAYTGWSGTHEVETLRLFARAASMQDFKDALQFFDVGSQNWAYADIHGNIAYYTSGELPIREDLQTLFFPAGLVHPGLIRDGTNTNKHQWLPLAHPQPHQALGTEILPFSEMPQIENPPAGYVLNANNDPIGTTLDNVSWNQFRAGFNGLLYLSAGYSSGERLGRIQRLFNDLLGGGGTLSVPESKSVQANNQLLDAEVLSPYLLTAYTNAIAPGAAPELQAIVADPRIGDAIGRLASWDFSTPTGITEGYDPGDNPAALAPPSPEEINASIAATIYAAWRGQVVQRVIDQTLASQPVPLLAYRPGSDQAMSALRRLLDNYAVNGGTGASLINFFEVPGVADQNVARDIILLESLRNGLDLLASAAFAPAFDNSTDLNEYRWGKLHRIVFSHALGGAFSVPPTGSPQNLSPDLPGFARAGGRASVDASSHEARADGLNEFMFSSGPARRVVATMTPGCPEVAEVIPGGENGAPGSPNSTDQLALWLVDAYKPLPVCMSEVNANAVETVQLVCGNAVVDPGEECDDANANNSDGCNDACLIVPIVTCLSPSVSADAQTCTAGIACTEVASCVDPRGGTVTTTCDPGGPYALGATDITVECTGGQRSSVATCTATVSDTTPPVVTVTTVPDQLWPPNHKMANVDASVTVTDACDPDPAFVLVSVVSSEPDDSPDGDDGHTINDVQEAAIGSADLQVLLRAERDGEGSGRTYTLTYQATDDSGNAGTGSAGVLVPLSMSDGVEPLTVTLSGAAATRLEWGAVTGALHYDVIRGDLAALRIDGSNVDLGTVTCIERGSLDADTTGNEDTDLPEPGQVFFYAVQFYDGIQNSSYGSESVGRARVVARGDCP